ncbi:MAG: PQQ-binding-like beta-propeller repeat protein [Saprospiraceae bacterium]
MKTFNSLLFFKVFCLMVILQSACKNENSTDYTAWKYYNGTPGALKYSSLKEIDTLNISSLQPIWTYQTGDADTAARSQIQTNPIVINGVLYGISPQLKLFALKAENGKEIWVFDPTKEWKNGPADRASFHNMINARGLCYWTDNKGEERLFYTVGSFTIAIDAKTGKPMTSFGEGGAIDLHENLGREVSDLIVVNTSPGVIYNDLLILGTRVDENSPAAPGHIRAYDVRTGKMKWIFHTIPQPGEHGYDTWEDKNAYKYAGGANVWSGFSLDEKKGVIFAGTGSAAYDFYGGNRKGSNLFANCLLAIDANTGKRKWHFQFIHHDVWDKDLPTPPVLTSLERNGKPVDVVIQTTKNGQIFVFERENGKPFFPIVETKVPTNSDLEGEKPWPTQPIPSLPEPFSRQTLTKSEINPYLEGEERTWVEEKMATLRYGHAFVLPGKTPSLIYPGFDGGGEWGGSAVDPQEDILWVNSNEMPWIMEMKAVKKREVKEETIYAAGKRLFEEQCAVCHGENKKGLGNNPSLENITSRYNQSALTTLLNSGRRMMPSFKRLPDAEKEAIASYLLALPNGKQAYVERDKRKETAYDRVPYKMAGYNKFLTPKGNPAISPPWGSLNAINLKTGKLLWKVPLGEYPELKKKGVPPTGTENYGGPVVTAGGLVFIAGTPDKMFRAFNKMNGKLVWSYELPFAAFATPAMYKIGDKQFITIACGGGKLKSTSGDAYVTFAIPD